MSKKILIIEDDEDILQVFRIDPIPVHIIDSQQDRRPRRVEPLQRAGVDFDESMGITPSRAACLDGNGKIVIER